MRSFEQNDEAHKYFAAGRLANEAQAQLQLYDLSVGEYLVHKYALWLDFRTIDENELQGMGRRIENTSKGITWASKGLHLPNHGCSVQHQRWRIRFCSLLD